MNKIQKKKLFFLLIGFALTSVFIIHYSSSVLAQDKIFDISFPNNPTDTAPETITGAIQSFYKYALAISGILAAGMIAYGALNIALSGGIPDRMSEGKDAIYSALWGILLLFGSYFILKTINPELVILREPELADVVTPGFCVVGNPRLAKITPPLLPCKPGQPATKTDAEGNLVCGCLIDPNQKLKDGISKESCSPTFYDKSKKVCTSKTGSLLSGDFVRGNVFCYCEPKGEYVATDEDVQFDVPDCSTEKTGLQCINAKSINVPKGATIKYNQAPYHPLTGIDASNPGVCVITSYEIITGEIETGLIKTNIDETKLGLCASANSDSPEGDVCE